MTRRILFAAFAGAMLLAPAGAQPVMQRNVSELGKPNHEGSVRVQSSISYFVPGPSGDSDEAQKLRENARRSIYETAGRECELLMKTLARECRLESVNSNISNRNYGSTQPEGFTINGSMTFRITLK
jgi:hypothetical protein